MVVDWAVLNPLIVAVIGMGGVWLTAKIQHKGGPENALINQLQEEMGKLRLRMERFEARDRVYIPHILRLNQHIELGKGPPAPKIPKVIEEYLAEQED